MHHFSQKHSPLSLFSAANIYQSPLPSKAMMDRQKQDELPKMQVGFINAICLPIYKELFELHPSCKPLYDGVLNNRDMWQSLADEAEAGTEHLLLVTEGVGWGGGGVTSLMRTVLTTDVITHKATSSFDAGNSPSISRLCLHLPNVLRVWGVN